jgi:hypothetical protein
VSDPRAIDLLASIDASLKKLVAIAERRQSIRGGGASSSPAIAPDRDLDSQYGDEEIKGKDPRDWSGESMKGRRMSECPPEYLDMIAERYDYFAQKNDAEGKKDDRGRPKSNYDRRSAARARGWAARLRAGWKPPAPTPLDESDVDDPGDFDNDDMNGDLRWDATGDDF